jgi:hypothetical protein
LGHVDQGWKMYGMHALSGMQEDILGKWCSLWYQFFPTGLKKKEHLHFNNFNNHVYL